MTQRRVSYLDPYLPRIIELRKEGYGYTAIAKIFYGAGLRTPSGGYQDEYHQVAAMSGNMRAIIERWFIFPKRQKTIAWNGGEWTPERQAIEIAVEHGL